jgi:DNA-binding response OmpR family regulator
MRENSAVRVLVVDDHQGIRAGLASLLDGEYPRLRVVGSAASADEAMELARIRQPDVVVLDADLDGEDGLALIPLLRQAATCQVVVLSSMQDSVLAAHALRMGASACMHKMAPADELLDCIEHAAAPAAARTPMAVGANPTIQGGREMPHLIERMANVGAAFIARDDGVTAIEYGLLAALIAVAIIGALNSTSDSMIDIYEYWSGAVNAAVGGGT